MCVCVYVCVCVCVCVCACLCLHTLYIHVAGHSYQEKLLNQEANQLNVQVQLATNRCETKTSDGDTSTHQKGRAGEREGGPSVEVGGGLEDTQLLLTNTHDQTPEGNLPGIQLDHLGYIHISKTKCSSRSKNQFS